MIENTTEEKDKCYSDSVHKQQFFHWTIDLIAECSREVAKQYKSSQVWSGDLTAEKNIIKSFIKGKKMEEHLNGLVIHEQEETILVNRGKFNELIKFLSNYDELTKNLY